MEDFGHRPIDILELQITSATLQNEVLMRYVSSPANLKLIRQILRRTFDDLGKLQVSKENLACPNNWIHIMCRCITPTIEGQSYVKPKNGKSHDHAMRLGSRKGNRSTHRPGASARH